MEIVLLENIKGLGQIGDIKNVADGYGRNFLLPRRLAKLATPGAIKEIDSLKKGLEKQLKEEVIQTQSLIQKLQNLEIVIKTKTTPKGTLYEATDKTKISQELKNLGFDIDEEKIVLEKPIKKIGEYEVGLNLLPESTANIKIKIEKE